MYINLFLKGGSGCPQFNLSIIQKKFERTFEYILNRYLNFIINYPLSVFKILLDLNLERVSESDLRYLLEANKRDRIESCRYKKKKDNLDGENTC